MKSFKFTLPMLAVFLGLVALIGTAAVDAENRSQQVPQWTYTPAPSGPLDQDNYEPYQGDLSTICPQVADICGVTAPIDPASDPNDPKPDLSDPDLQDRISQEDISNGDVFLLSGM